MLETNVPSQYGEIYDRGYQHYLGKRLGRQHALWALTTYSMKRALGIKKSWTAKVIPIILYLAVIATVLIVIGIEAFLGDAGEQAMTYPDYFFFIYLVIGAFVATIAPEMLCGDRRERVLQLYFSRSISRLDYVLAKLAAVAILTTSISVAPVVVLWLFRQLMADSPGQALVDNLDDLWRVVVSGSLIALLFGCAGLVVSSFTGRKSIATAIIFLSYLYLEFYVNSLVDILESDRVKNIVALFSPGRAFAEMNSKMFGTYTIDEWGHTGFDVGVYIAAFLSFVIIGVLIIVWRYVPED